MRRLIGAPRPPGSPPIRVIDVGVGSGAVAVTLAVLLRRRGMARRGRDHRDRRRGGRRSSSPRRTRSPTRSRDRITFLTADLLPGFDTRRWDVVAANLPYVRTDAIPSLPRAASFEPVARARRRRRTACGSSADCSTSCPTALADDGVALLEIGGDQGEGMRALAAERLRGWSCDLEPDLGGLPRVAVLRRASAPDRLRG